VNEASQGRVRIFAAERILAMDGSEPESFATRGDRIIATGPRAAMMEQYRDAELVDLEGALVVPGFNDAHCHPSQAALARVRVDLTAVSSPAGVREALAQRLKSPASTEWVIAQAFDERLVGENVVDRKFLDTISATQPIVVVHYSFHRAVANSRALEQIGYRTAQDAPSGGELLVDADGELNGWMFERAWLDPWLPGRGRESIAAGGEISARIAALGQITEELHAVGITSYCDAIVTPVEQEMYAAALADGSLTTRVNMLLWHSYFDETAPIAPASNRLQVAGVKMMLDGALSGGTCLCRQPYARESGTDNGLQILSDEELRAEIGRVHSAGMRAAVHANGDRAIEKVLEVVESLPARPDGITINHRIEHCSIVDEQLIRRLKQAQIMALPFSAFVHLYGEKIASYYGDDRARMTSAHKSMLDAALVVGGSSDYPLVPINPLLGIQSMVTRESTSGQVVGPDQRLSVSQALGVYTTGSAHATGEGSIKGKLTPGHLADFVVLDKDLTTIDAHEIVDVKVRSTWVGADQVWTAN